MFPGTKMPPKKPRNPKGHQLAEKFPSGQILQDLRKKEWVLGDVIGQGGFGLIYLAADRESGKTGPDSEYVVKIEPISNGPLFCELAFYQRVAKPEMIDAWVKSKKVKYLGVPKFIASGQHSYKGAQYRFMVMERFGKDLQSIFEGAGKRFDQKTVYSLALRLIDALEFLHDNGYVHADIKAANCLLGYHAGKVDVNKVYLVDFGLAMKYAPDDKHRVYKEEPKKAHDGTIEFTSRDAHKGVDPSRRGDMEILGYCLLQWLCGKLPWEDKLADKNYVSDSKHKYMNDLSSLMKKCFPQGSFPDEIEKYLKAVKNLGYDTKPNYSQMRDIFSKGLVKLGVKDTWKLALPVVGVAGPSPKKTAQKRVMDADGKKSKSPRPATPKARAATPKAKPATPKARTPKAETKAKSKAEPQASPAAPKVAKKRAASPQKGSARTTTPVQKKAKVTAKSPAAARAAKAALDALTPIGDGPSKVNGVAKRAKSPAVNSPQPKRRKVVRKGTAHLVEMAVQTSPGLKNNR